MVAPVRRLVPVVNIWGGIEVSSIVRIIMRIKKEFVGQRVRAHFCARIHARENKPHSPSLREKSCAGFGGVPGSESIGIGGEVAGTRSGEG